MDKLSRTFVVALSIAVLGTMLVITQGQAVAP